MPLQDIPIKPGIYTISTPRGAEGRWKSGNHVRFWKGIVQKLGGWVVFASDTLFRGKARGVADWQSLALQKLIALGTHLKLYTWTGGQFIDITPLRTSGTLGTNPVTTTIHSALVSIAHTAHALAVGDYVHFSGATAVGGITVSGEYAVTSVTNADVYVITHSVAASSSATGGGMAVTYDYEIHVGNEDSIVGLGYGAGLYGVGTYGTPRTSSTLLAMARTWSLDNWGEDLIANPRGGAIYVWDTSVGLSGNRATLISGAPASAKAIFVSPENRHLVVLGAHDGSNDDPMLIRWSSTEDYTDFTPTALNTAGDKRLDRGNEIYCRVKLDTETLIFTDAAIYTMVFEGPPYVFSFDHKGSNGGIASPNAATEWNGIVYWMADKNFYLYDGQIRTLDCEVLNHVFDSINWLQRAKIWAGVNRKYGEVWWLYCSASSIECDVYVVYNTVERHWSVGTLARTLFVGDSDTFDQPFAAGTNGKLYSHENGVDDDTTPLDWSLESGDLDIGDGEYLMRIKKYVPDFLRIAGAVSLVLKGKKYPQSTRTLLSAAQTIRSDTEYVNPKLKARQIAIALSASGAANDFAMGRQRMQLVPHGKQ
jgi:hypothetical protein